MSLALKSDPMKVVLVGDGASGKTCMIESYTNDSFRNDYNPTVFDNYKCSVTIDNTEYQVTIWDTAGQDEYHALQSLSYPQCDIFLICFAVNDKTQFHNAMNKWYPELQKEVMDVPKLFVGTKIDLRDNFEGRDASKTVSMSAEAAAIELHRIGCEYTECSALTQEGLKATFDHAIKLVLKKRTQIMLKGKKKKNCTIF